jgi:hypothetical protein
MHDLNQRGGPICSSSIGIVSTRMASTSKAAVVRFRCQNREEPMLAALTFAFTRPQPPNLGKGEQWPAFIDRYRNAHGKLTTWIPESLFIIAACVADDVGIAPASHFIDAVDIVTRRAGVL